MPDKRVSYLSREEINIEKWDACILSAKNGAIYAYSFYLDKMAKHWDALVVGNYEAVMPIVWKRKFGIKYIYTPPFIQQLGIYGNELTDSYLIKSVFNQVVAKFSFMDLSLNLNPPIEGNLRVRTNYVLHLDKTYEEIRAGYSDECKVNIKKAQKRGCVFVSGIGIDKTIKLYRIAYSKLNRQIKDQDYENFRKLAIELEARGQLISYGINHEKTGELLFAALILRSANRLYYIMAAPTQKGRHARAAYFCIDEIIRLYSGTSITFDFEGSDIPGVAAFYMRFGSVNERYYNLRVNKLPWLLRLFKR